MKITISKENYLKAIAEAHAEGETVIAATLARWLNVSPPAVTMAIRRLKRDGFIEVDQSGHIELTADGKRIAERILHRHHLIERMLVEIFGMEWFKVHDEAERLEHAVSEDFEQLLIQKLGAGQPCAHGNQAEISTPGERRKRGWQTLDQVPTPSRVTVVSVYERDRQLLEYLDGLSVQPGAQLDILGRNYDETLSLKVDGNPVQIGASVAGKIWVKREPAAGG
ncbi:MAG: metal-dependent transcriptional regulator [Bryobacteraceae bacterium]